MCVVQFPDGVEWNPGQTVRIVVGIAAKSDEHLGILAALTDVLDDTATADRLAHTSDPKKRGEGNDGFGYSVSYGPHRVNWSDFTADPPERVQRLYSMLDELYERYAPSS